MAGLLANLLKCLQSVLDAAARSVAGLQRSDWLQAPRRIKSKLAVIVYRSVHGTAPRYLSDLLRRIADVTSRRRRGVSGRQPHLNWSSRPDPLSQV